MKIINQYRNAKIEKEVEGTADLVLGNDLGDFLFLTHGEETRYRGYYFADSTSYEKKLDVYKVIDEIRIQDGEGTVELKNSLFKVERKSKDGLTENYFMPDGLHSLCLKASRQVQAEIILDVRSPYDSRVMGRFYKLEETDGCLVVEFTKRRDWSEDHLGDKKEFSLYLAIRTDKDALEKIGRFVPQYYARDQRRNSYPWDRHVYAACKLGFKRAVFAVSKTRKGAIEEANQVFEDFDRLYKKTRDDMSNLEVSKITDAEIKMACLCAQNSIRTLLVQGKYAGAYAGIPWFFQFWHRDEALSLGQLHKVDKKLAEGVLNAHLDSILQEDFFQRQRFSDTRTEVQCADALGYLARECYELFKRNRISKAARREIVKKFEKTVPKLLKERTTSELAVNFQKETWMDTLDRDGYRIEIQAGRLALYKLLFLETGNDQYRILMESTEKAVLGRFYRQEMLWDTPNSSTIRPNVFLAYHLYPDLLSQERWERCFDLVLPKLYLPWGGIATVAHDDHRFLAQDSGEGSPSYHNGDAWYFLSNIAATALYRVNPGRYSQYINDIMEASTQEILYQGAIGHHAEISSAANQESAGCLAQLWSAAMYLDFFDTVVED
jgi:hypothetical protein